MVVDPAQALVASKFGDPFAKACADSNVVAVELLFDAEGPVARRSFCDLRDFKSGAALFRRAKTLCRMGMTGIRPRAARDACWYVAAGAGARAAATN